MNVQATNVLTATLKARDAGYRYIIHEGSTRSGKTYAVCQALMLWALADPGLEIDVVRKTLPALKRDAMQTFQEVLEAEDLYRESIHNKTEHTFEVGGSTVGFFSADQEQKLRGPERDILYASEANALSRKDWRQLTRRTRECIVLDYNPSHGANHWIDRELMRDPGTIVIRSTYEHNPFLRPEQVADIEKDVPVYEESDGTLVEDRDLTYEGSGVLVRGNPEDWAVYGRGERATSPALVYRHWQERAWGDDVQTLAYGLDFGTAVPSALVEIGIEEMPATHDDRLYWREILYEPGLTTPDIIARMNAADVRKDIPIYADHEDDRIQQIKNAGYLITKANKNVESGIDTVKQYALCLTPGSVNLKSEIQTYKRKVVDGIVLDQVVKSDDHGMDAGRYGTHSYFHGERPGNTARAFASVLDLN